DHLWWSDPGPALVQAARFGATAVEKIAGRVARRWQQQHRHGLLAEALVRRNLLPAVWLPTAGEVLFLCHGNIYRSPFAASYFNARAAAAGWSGPIARSAGFHERSSRRSPPRARVFARGLGVDLADHRSRQVSAAMVQSADAIFVMDG